MLDFSGNNVKLWKNKHEGSKGVWYSYSITVSKKVEGKYINKPVKFLIPRELQPPESIPNGALIDFEGFPTLDIYTGRDGQEHREVAVFVQKLVFKDHEENGNYDNFAQAEEDLPF